MAPVAQPMKSIQAPKQLNAATSRQKIHRKTTTDVIFDERLTSKSRRKEEIHNADSVLTNTEVKVSSSETLDMERPKSKWLAKRQRELERLQLLVPVSKKPSSPTSLSKHEGDKSFSEISKGPNQGTSQTTLKNSSLASECSVQHENPKLKTKVHFLEELERLTNSQNKNFDLVSRAKEHKARAFFTSKTSVWDHINYSLYYKRSYNPFVPFPIIETSKDSALETMQQSNKPETAVTKVAFPSLTLSESIHQPADDILNSRLQGVRSLSCSSETAYRIQFSTAPLGSYANENIWKKDRFPGASSQSEVPLVQRKLGDVRLNELGVWLAARTPVSPGEIVTMLKHGWQWYYGKYINVRRGGIGGISMLLTGYCVLCYIWSYPHLKKERWRKYH
ncbi:ATP synthase subunit f, mitochondrial [Anabarilius grahami]|uniref:ATP synthase subunit f, mitochondrial n=1 Tax=Anabarilius grahami TaxID=495550 RepID=A0A3N0XPD9_ANAGA|nr:ATP synthase subunit f, mitochondrial [Anabarilius grahami]